MPAWPGTLPTDVLVGTYNEEPPDFTIRSQNEYGPDKVRRRSTAIPTRWQATMLMTKTQTETLDTFYETTLEGGVLQVQLKNMRTEVVENQRFLQRPSYAHAGCSSNLGEELFRVSLNMEILP